MNAGAYGGEIGAVCTRVQVMDLQGKTRSLTADELDFSYRHSALQETGQIILWADFSLKEKPQEEIRGQMRELLQRRKASQPLELPSAGSAFKRPKQGYAAALIEQAGLKGFRVGGAAVSEKHAGFVVNLGGATAEDVKAVLVQVSEQVYQTSGIRLEPEIRIW